MKTPGKKKVVLVLGMHRSGTSALMAGIHSVLDVPLAIETNHAGKDNPKGFFENSQVVQLNDRILNSCGASWEKIGACLTLDAESPEYKEYRREAMDLLASRFGDSLVWGMKDPRFSVLLPFWDEVLEELGAEVYRVIALRHPLEVALSQQTRHHTFPDFHLAGKDVDYTLNLWYWYNDRLLRDLQDDRNWIVGFDDLLADPGAILRRIGQILDRPVLSDKLESYGTQFLEKELKRHNVGQTTMAMFQGRYAYVFTLYERLKAYSSGRQMSPSDVPEILKDLPDAQMLRSWVMPMYGYVDTLKSRLQETRNDLAEASRQTSELKGQCDTARSEVQSLRQENAQKDHRNVEFQAQLAAVQQDMVAVRAALAWQQKHNLKLKTELDRSSQAAAQAQKDIAQRDKANAELEAAILLKTKALADALVRIELAEQDIEQYREGVRRLKASRDDIQAQANSLRRQVNEISQQNEQAVSRIQGLQNELEGKDKTAAELNAEIVNKTKALADARHEIEQKMQEIARYRSELYEVYISGSWRHTVWFRKMRGVFK